MIKNKTLSKYDFKYNNISDKGKSPFFCNRFDSFGKTDSNFDYGRDTRDRNRGAATHCE